MSALVALRSARPGQVALVAAVWVARTVALTRLRVAALPTVQPFRAHRSTR